jgi:hypothetical protein
MGPWTPGDPLYERFTAGSAEKPDRIEASVLTVNYDPGRGVKYLGSALIVAGIFTMFYMKAYFFQPKRRVEDDGDAGDDDGADGGSDGAPPATSVAARPGGVPRRRAVAAAGGRGRGRSRGNPGGGR